MAHPLATVRARQLELAGVCAERLCAELTPSATRHAAELRSLLPSHVLGDVSPARAGDAQEAFAAALRREIGADCLSAVHGYTDFWATQLVRREPIPDHVPVLELDMTQATQISNKYGVTPGLLFRVVAMLTSQGELPLLGRLEGGKLLPNHQALHSWKSMFNWS